MSEKEKLKKIPNVNWVNLFFEHRQLACIYREADYSRHSRRVVEKGFFNFDQIKG